METNHSKFSPSKAAHWGACPAAVAVEVETREAQTKHAYHVLARNMRDYYRKETIKAQRVAADLSARSRSYLGALCVYHPSQVPPECRASAAAQQERDAQAYQNARNWLFLLDSIEEGPAS